MQDTTTQAMTEVALGLSMAFFALLVLALISISLPSGDDTKPNKANEIPHNELLQIQANKKQKEDQRQGGAQAQIIFLYWQGQYFNLQQELIEPSRELSALKQTQSNQDVVVAVPASTDLQQLLDIQASFAKHDVKLTQLSKEWELALAQHKPRMRRASLSND